ncbi:MAG: phospholipase A2 [Planctomycetota bacterium]
MSVRLASVSAALIVVFGLAAGTADAQLFSFGRGGCGGQGNRPCGPGGLANLLIPQGFLGADFRPACRRHDACYLNHTTGRFECDRQFRADLHASCRNSLLPGLCHLTAELYYREVRRYGSQYYSPLAPIMSAPAMMLGGQ